VDTFSELRADKNQIAEKMVSQCFICGLRSSDFERFGQGWKHHITKEHHMWDYLQVIVHVMLVLVAREGRARLSKDFAARLKRDRRVI
jgi:hypothetical protein